MIDERKIRRVELRAPDSRRELQELYSQVEQALEELHNQIRELQDGRLRIPLSPVDNPTNGSWYLSEDGSGNRSLNVYNESTGAYESSALT